MLTSNAQIQQQLLLQQQQQQKQQQNWPQQQQQQQQQGPQQHHRPSIGPPQLSLGDGIQIVVDDVDHFAKQQHVPGKVIQGLLNRWTSQLDLGCTTGGLERVVSVHNST